MPRRRDQELLSAAAKIRLQQLALNTLVTENVFKVPVHLAIGHELIAATAAQWMPEDKFFLPHRNIHFNLASGIDFRKVVAELQLSEHGVNGGRSGSMNLASQFNGIVLSSSILGGHLGISVGYAHAQRFLSSSSLRLTWCVLGDGAIEEGTFYESLLLAKSLRLPIIFCIEDNGWSLATKIEDRRSEIKVSKLAKSLGVGFTKIGAEAGITKFSYKLAIARDDALRSSRPVLVYHPVSTLGSYEVPFGDGSRVVNYHSGPARNLTLKDFLEGRDSSAEDQISKFIRSNNFHQERDQFIADLLEVIHEVL